MPCGSWDGRVGPRSSARRRSQERPCSSGRRRRRPPRPARPSAPNHRWDHGRRSHRDRANARPATSANEYTKSTGAVHYDAPGATTSTTVTFNANNLCRVTNTAEIATLLAITPTGGNLGFRDATAWACGRRTTATATEPARRRRPGVDTGARTDDIPARTSGSRRPNSTSRARAERNLAYTLDEIRRRRARPTLPMSAEDNGPDAGSARQHTGRRSRRRRRSERSRLSPANAQKAQVSASRAAVTSLPRRSSRPTGPSLPRAGGPQRRLRRTTSP